MEGGGGLIEDFGFGRFRLDARDPSLWCGSERVPVRARSLDILRLLAAADGQLVTKDRLIAKVWGGAVVEENALQAHVSALRKALGESVGSQRHIVTVPGRGYRFVREPATAPTPPVESVSSFRDLPSIAVLRFQNMSGDPEQEYFIDGVAEDIITALARVPALFVIARTSSFAYGRDAADLRVIGRALGARYVLEGSIRKSGSRLRITGQLIQTDTGTHLWAEHFDGEVADVFRFQDELIAKVVGALVPSLHAAEMERARRKAPENLDAYELYLRALVVRRDGTREGNDAAIQLLEQALALDPSFAAASVILGATWALRVTAGWISGERREQAEALRNLRRAVQLDPNGAEGLATLARVISLFEQKSDEVRSLTERALALGPNSPMVLRCCGYAFVHIGEPQIALDCLRHGLDISPRDLWAFDAWGGMTLALIQLGRDQEALAAARNAVRGPLYTVALRTLASALGLLGQREEADEVVRQLLAIDPQCTVSGLAARYGEAYRHNSVRFLEGLRLAGLPR